MEIGEYECSGGMVSMPDENNLTTIMYTHTLHKLYDLLFQVRFHINHSPDHFQPKMCGKLTPLPVSCEFYTKSKVK